MPEPRTRARRSAVDVMPTPTSKPEWSLLHQCSRGETLTIIGTLCKTFTTLLARQTVHGRDGFLAFLDARSVPSNRKRGLITISNHISIIDDPLMWAFLPYRFLLHPSNMRWSLGSYDLCFKYKLLGHFFYTGQVLPTHRLKHSPLGGMFQPTMREVIRLLSDPPHPMPSLHWDRSRLQYLPAAPTSDPFSLTSVTRSPAFTTTGQDYWPSLSSYSAYRYSWIHVFPEGRVHQHPDKNMRYFRWGVSRMILEADECPDIIPMWIEGFNDVYPEDRTFLRPLPRPANLDIWIGDNVGGEVSANPFLGLRAKWQDLVRRETIEKGLPELELGILPESLKHGHEAVELRMECTRLVRDAVVKLRRKRGLGDEDPKASLVETWREEGIGEETGRKNDGSMVGDG